MIFSRVWAMPNKWTFRISPIFDLICRYQKQDQMWIDPFAGFNSPADVTNDLNPEAPTVYHMDASEFLKTFLEKTVDGVIFDPPYSLTQVSRSYQDIGLKFIGKNDPTGSYRSARDEVSRVVRIGGTVISFGWNSNGMGKGRGFEIIEILLCAHGGNHNDTICTVERRIEG